MLVRAGAQVDKRSSNGNGPIHDAIALNRLDCAGVLLAAHPDLSLPNRDGLTALDVAVLHGRMRFARALLKKGAESRSLDPAGLAALRNALSVVAGDAAGGAETFGVARDGSANVSPASAVTVQLVKDRARPTTPARLRATNVTKSSLVLRWNPSRDNVGVKDYVVYQQVGRRWRAIGRPIAGSTRAVRIVRLRSRSTYVFRVHARDSAGNVSAASRVLRTRTR